MLRDFRRVLIAIVMLGTCTSLFAQTFLRACTQTTALTKDERLAADVSSLKAATASFLGSVEGFDCSMYDHALRKMHGLQLSGRNFHHLELLQDMGALESLDVSRNDLSAVGVLGKLSNLKALDVSLNRIADITELSALVNLEILRMDANKITDIHAVGALTQLREVSANFNAIVDISPISGLKELLWVHFSSNQIQNLAGLDAFLSTPGMFDISNNRISDFGALDQDLRKRVTITGNPSHKEQLDAVLTKVPSMTVEFYGDTPTVDSIKESYADHKEILACSAPRSITYKSSFDFTRYLPPCGNEWH